MNKKEVSEIKKQFKMENNKFTINKIANAYVTVNGGMKDIKYFNIQSFSLMPENECDFYMENCKKTLGGQLGKGLVEYNFPDTAYEEDGGQNRLYNLFKCELSDEEEVKDYIHFLEEHLNYPSNFYITIALCSYSIPQKTKDDEELEEDYDGEMYNFLLISVNMASLTDIGLYFNEEEQVVEKKFNTDMQIVKGPCDGILFPVYNERTTDINSALVFTKKPKKPNEELISNVLGCDFNLSADDEKDKFAQVLTRTLGDDLNYEIISNINENIREVIISTEENTEMPSLNKDEIRHILEISGVEDKNLEEFDDIYKEELKDLSLKPVNMIDSTKIAIKAPDVTINVKPQSSDKVRTEIVNGRKCLIIEVDDSIEVNGIDVLT
ncbi:DUF4317 family protein [Thomasclavelia cocleata]|uniref:DUF4317 family protein n=1 Tax=Thomasclavelia cocleata TaxID=69824 RepID=UPI00256EF0A1|nr:DUF4317 family protein [Thomasclavelia cocleata]